jgi:hypothetical protein
LIQLNSTVPTRTRISQLSPTFFMRNRGNHPDYSKCSVLGV